MLATTSPREVFEALIGRISAAQWEELAELYAEDAVAEIPFALPGPDRVEGREQLRARFAAAAGGLLRLHVSNVVVHETADPEVIIAEFDYHGQISITGRSFDAANVQVLRIRNGLIVHTRDFHHHLAFAAAGGHLSESVAAFEAAFEGGIEAGIETVAEGTSGGSQIGGVSE